MPQLPVAVTTPRVPVALTRWALLPPFVVTSAGDAGVTDPPVASSETVAERTAPVFAAEDDVWGLWPLIDVQEPTRADEIRAVPAADMPASADALATRLEMLALRIRREGVQALTTAGSDEILVSALSTILGARTAATP